MPKKKDLSDPPKRRSTKTKWLLKWAPLYTPIITIVGFGITYLYFHNNEEAAGSRSKDEYAYEAQKNAPCIVCDTIELKEGRFKVEDLLNVEEFERFKNLPGPVRILPIPVGSFQISGRVKVRNATQTSTIASVDLISFSDTNTTQVPWLREKVLQENTWHTKGDQFQYNHNLIPGQRDSFDIDWYIQDPETTGNFVLHFMINYTNPAGQVFDSYFWFPFSINPNVKTNYQWQKLIDGRYVVHIDYFAIGKEPRLLVLDRIVPDYHLYTQDEKLVYDRFMKRLRTLELKK